MIFFTKKTRFKDTRQEQFFLFCSLQISFYQYKSMLIINLRNLVYKEKY